MADKRYITTSIAYVNAQPHIGYALELVQADCLARWYRLKGYDTWFLTGTDEHGSKIAQVAANEGIEPQAVADRNSELFAALKPILNLSNDDFIRTSDQARHFPGAQKLWQQLVATGDIYKDKYVGLYCVGCEAFVTEKDLIEGRCPIHKSEPEHIEEENYFFRLSKYSDRIAQLIESKELEIIPAGRGKEILNVVKSGLTDISFSRPKSKLPWGVPVPDDPDQTMYVWCDALSNYISAIGYGQDDKHPSLPPISKGRRNGVGYVKNEAEFNKWWPADLHCIGKDILRFHAAIWPGMLLSAGLPLPKAILVHGFITSEGQKMSKSIGNVVDPTEAMKRYGTDVVRYYLLREIPTTDDGDFAWARFDDLYNNELANNLGNLLSRVVQMAKKFSGGAVPKVTDEPAPATETTIANYEQHLAKCELQKAVIAVNQYISELNALVDAEKPWELAKQNDQERLDKVLYQLLEGLRIVALLLAPFLPATAEKISATLGLYGLSMITNWSEEAVWGKLPAETKLGEAPILFPKEH
ncbi:TPA: methionine--tRNA ligase [Patescibacteria group bacterium]|uniref:Methionine--tRNA ligase n=1 Tax=candidate division Kazan bacterium GW2011_GWB1_45_10 TaxID=1620411 RepID=A0A0G1NRQ3_UNCK3|nr:MAG: Methionine-tRNA ligase [candidate division Kazan bacterium GW2011_GWB1_45_10]HAR55141.1 methionine--tRNA ligase [Patescibacteria group bacterium]HCR42167.1 methionine--tRNA ligase [Patescibacteria group bacterium]